jgi:hypothetical protein
MPRETAMSESNTNEPVPVRSASEVARRCLVLYAVVAAGHKTSRPDLVTWLRREGLWDYASPEEVSLFKSKSPSREQIIAATWRAESLMPLLWAIGRSEAMPPPTALCDLQLLRSCLPGFMGSTGEFVSEASLRDEAEIMEAHEETYQAHWAIRDAILNGTPIPDGYNPEVVQERHLALNWLISPDQEWDDVTTDT